MGCETRQQCLTVDEVTGSRVIADGVAFGGAGTSDVLNGRTEQRKLEQASQPHDGTVWLLSLCGQEGSKPLVKCGGLSSHSTRHRKDEGSKRRTFNRLNSLLVSSFLCVFVSSVC